MQAMRTAVLCRACLALVLFPCVLPAQVVSPGLVDVDFLGNAAPNHRVNALVVQPDGRIVIVGKFTGINGVSRSGVARLNADGTLDLSFDPGAGVDDEVFVVRLDSAGRILMGGRFTQVAGVSRRGVARLHSDGSLDTTFAAGDGPNAPVLGMAVQSDDKVVIGGGFTSVSGVGRNGIARLNTNGTVDTGFNPGTGTDGEVFSVAVDANGRIVAGGAFTSINGSLRSGVVRLTAGGAVDSTFAPVSGANSAVLVVAVDASNKVWIGGFFTFVNFLSRNGVARLNTDGSTDTAFNPGTGTDAQVQALTVQSDGKLLLGGAFSSVNGTARLRLARLNSNGGVDTTFNPGGGATGTVLALAVQANGQVLAGGEFLTFDSTARPYLARVGSNGALDASFNPGAGASSAVLALKLAADGKAWLGGDFLRLNGLIRNGVGRLHVDGTVDAAFDPGPGPNSTVLALALQADGRAVMGGLFTEYRGISRSGVARVNTDGSLDTGFNPGAGANNSVAALALQGDGKVLLGGDFTQFNGSGRIRLARLNANGALDSGFDPGSGASSSVFALAVQPDGEILVGGAFLTLRGTARQGIGRLLPTGALDTSFAPSPGTDYIVRALAVQPDGRIVLGGDFTNCNNVLRRGIARLHANGALDTSFDPGAGFAGAPFQVRALALQPDGRILAGGLFTSYDGISRQGIVRLRANGQLDPSFDPGAGLNAWVNSLAVRPGRQVLAAGSLTSANLFSRPGLVQLHGDAPPVFAPASLTVPFTGAFQFGLETTTNQTLVLESSTDLLNWTPLITHTFPTGSQTFIDSQATGPARFYRARIQP
jgi:uncharacterized delta-60 repeat protein